LPVSVGADVESAATQECTVRRPEGPAAADPLSPVPLPADQR